MSTSLRFEIPGPVQPKERPRAPHFYTPPKTRKYENHVRQYAEQAMENREVFHGPVSLGVQILCDIPKSWPRKKILDALNGDILPMLRCDLDNCIKSIADGMNTIVYNDDRQIVHLTVMRSYATAARAIVTVDEVKNAGDLL